MGGRRDCVYPDSGHAPCAFWPPDSRPSGWDTTLHATRAARPCAPHWASGSFGALLLAVRPAERAPASTRIAIEIVAKEQDGRPASWRSRLPLVPRHTPAAASRTSPVSSPRGEQPIGESLSSGARVGLYDAHKSRGQQRRGPSRGGYGYRLGAEETLDVDRWRLRLSPQAAADLIALLLRTETALSRERRGGHSRRCGDVLVGALWNPPYDPNPRTPQRRLGPGIGY